MAIARNEIRALLAMAVLGLAISAAGTWWRDHQASQVGQRIVARAAAGDIRMLSSVDCVFCARARQWMTAQGIGFNECFIERDAGCAAQYRALMMPGTPVMLVRGQAQAGFDPQWISRRLGG